MVLIAYLQRNTKSRRLPRGQIVWLLKDAVLIDKERLLERTKGLLTQLSITIHPVTFFKPLAVASGLDDLRAEIGSEDGGPVDDEDTRLAHEGVTKNKRSKDGHVLKMHPDSCKDYVALTLD